MRPKKAFNNSTHNNGESDFEKLKFENPELWKKLTEQFETGRKIVAIQKCNGLNRHNEETLRYYFLEYVGRYLNYGPTSFPTSFNVLEPFFNFDRHYSILQIIEEEESYSLSLLDFLDYVTASDFKLSTIDFHESISENIIHHFTFDDFEEYNFSKSSDKEFLISGLSLIRRGSEVSMLMQAGESFSPKEAEEYFQKNNRKKLEDSIDPSKKSLGLEIGQEGEPKAVLFEEMENFWLHSVAVLFDIENKLIDIRYIARDQHLSYQVTTDDFSYLSRKSSVDIEKFIKNNLERLSQYDPVFDFSKYCLSLPLYILENEESLVDVTYETNLSSILNSPISKRKYKSVPHKYKHYAKPFYYLESDRTSVIKNEELDDSCFTTERKGYWKRIGLEEQGLDKKGHKIIGKTWVERNDSYFIAKKGTTKIKESEFYDSENAGSIYIMRQSTHEENIFKIGLTKRDPNLRRKELSNTSSVDHFFIITKYYTKDCKLAEKLIHEKLDRYRLTKRREFFKCELQTIIDTCFEVTQAINK